MIDAPQIVQTEAQPYAYLPVQVHFSEIKQTMDAGVAEVLEALKAQGVTPDGAWFTHHLRRPTETFDFEICFPVAKAVEPMGRILPGVWPAMKVARTIYRGNYSGLPHAWPELQQWMTAEGLEGGAEFWERYLIGPNTESDPAKWQTELNWPLAPR